MIHIRFKNLEKSELARQAVYDRVDVYVNKFPSLAESKIQVTLEMQNSPFQAGPDFFNVKLHIVRGKYDGVTVEKSDPNLYVALAKLAEQLQEVLNRTSDHSRVLERKKARQWPERFRVHSRPSQSAELDLGE